MNNLKWFYKNRRERSKWLVERFGDEFNNSEKVLDIGCWECDLEKYLDSDIDYFGIDVAGKPNKKIDLDTIDKLPFSDNEFDVVVCADVLEHIENLHLVFDESCRVAKKGVIITLPNPVVAFWKYLFKMEYKGKETPKNKFGKFVKFYGLPKEKPVDRHRWFFNYEEALDFIKYRSNKNSFYVEVAETDLGYENRLFKKIIKNMVGLVLNKDLVRKKSVFLIKPS